MRFICQNCAVKKYTTNPRQNEPYDLRSSVCSVWAVCFICIRLVTSNTHFLSYHQDIVVPQGRFPKKCNNSTNFKQEIKCRAEGEEDYLHQTWHILLEKPMFDIIDRLLTNTCLKKRAFRTQRVNFFSVWYVTFGWLFGFDMIHVR